MAVVRLDKIQASYVGNIESVAHTAEMSNGNVVQLGGFNNGQDEVREAVVVADVAEEVVLVAAPEVMYDEKKGLSEFVIPADKPARAYHLVAGDVFTITDDGITGATVVGQYVIPSVASLQLTATADLATYTGRFVGKVLRKETFNDVPATMIQVVKA